MSQHLWSCFVSARESRGAASRACLIPWGRDPIDVDADLVEGYKQGGEHKRAACGKLLEQAAKRGV